MRITMFIGIQTLIYYSINKSRIICCTDPLHTVSVFAIIVFFFFFFFFVVVVVVVVLFFFLPFCLACFISFSLIY